jgi:zinc protease
VRRRCTVTSTPRRLEASRLAAWLGAMTAVVALLVATDGLRLQAQAPDRSSAPKPGSTPRFTPPEAESRTLANGVAAWIVPVHEVPVVQVAVVVRAGAAGDPAEKAGLASLTADLLDEGAGNRSSLELADAADYLGADLSTGSSFDASWARVNVPVARLAAALDILGDVVLRPRFPEAELERLRKEGLTAMLQARDDPQAIAARAFPRLLYGPKHRYGLPQVGTPESLRALTLVDVRGFYASAFRPDRAMILIAGDVSVDAVLPELERVFGSWRATGPAPALPSVPRATQPAKREIFLVDKPNAAQSQIRIGWLGVARSTPDFVPITVLNTILGGSFTSRLNQNLRETHGYAYGASSQFVTGRDVGPFVASAGVQTDKTAESLTEFFKEFNGIRTPLAADECARAANYVALGFPAEFETTSDLVAKLQQQLVFELPKDEYATFVDRVLAVTPADASRVAQKYIQPDRFLVVVVGDRTKIEAPVRALNLGPVTVLSLDQAIGPQ